MVILEVALPLKNESSTPMELVLEPMAERFIILPGDKIVIHAECDARTNNVNFTIAPNDSFLIVYAPGEIAGFVDCFVTKDGTRLAPEQD